MVPVPVVAHARQSYSQQAANLSPSLQPYVHTRVCCDAIHREAARAAPFLGNQLHLADASLNPGAIVPRKEGDGGGGGGVTSDVRSDARYSCTTLAPNTRTAWSLH